MQKHRNYKYTIVMKAYSSLKFPGKDVTNINNTHHIKKKKKKNINSTQMNVGFMSSSCHATNMRSLSLSLKTIFFFFFNL
jgi:hypothetical protein